MEPDAIVRQAVPALHQSWRTYRLSESEAMRHLDRKAQLKRLYWGLSTLCYWIYLVSMLAVIVLLLTEGLYIPTFISSVINTTPLYFAAVGLLMAVFLIVGIANMFILHSVILDGLSVQEAGLQSKRLMKKNWKDYLKQNLIYAVITGTAGLFATPLYVMKIT